MAKVTIIYTDGRIETKTMSRDEAIQLQMQKSNGQLPPSIQDVTVEYPSNPT